MKKALKYALLVLIIFLFISVIIKATCWIAEVEVTIGEVIKAELIAIFVVCCLVSGCAIIVGIIESILKD